MLEKIEERLKKEAEKMLQKEELTIEEINFLITEKSLIEAKQEKITLEEQRKKSQKEMAELVKKALEV